MQGVVMAVVTGTIKSYDPKSRKGGIVLDDRAEVVLVDSLGSQGVRLSVGLKVELQMIHRPDGVYASRVRLIL
ncbi:cold-shock protein [Pseudomonas marginalis]|nr:cold-shock protein [Pseudomonas marginalis]